MVRGNRILSIVRRSFFCELIENRRKIYDIKPLNNENKAHLMAISKKVIVLGKQEALIDFRPSF